MPRNITHDLRVFGAEVVADDLVIDLYGGPTNACGSVQFTFTDDEQLHKRHALVMEWSDDQRPVVLVTDDLSIMLVDERRLTDPSSDSRIE